MLHVYPHAPALHVAVECAGTGHVPQRAPQVATAVLSAQTDPHTWNPVPHVNPHAPAAHVAVPLVGVVHKFTQLPQCVGSVCVLTHELPQSICVPEHVGTHVGVALAVEHIGVPPVQANAHVPQFVAVFSGASQPLLASWSQSPYADPAPHVIPHVVPSQVAVPLVALHGAQSAPQWAASVLLTQAPAQQ